MVKIKNWIIPLLSAIVAIVISTVAFNDLPDRMAIHFNQLGSPDNWISKPFAAFILPALTLFIPFLLLLSIKLEQDDNKRRRVKATIVPITAILSIMLLTIHIFIIAYNLGYELKTGMFATILVGILFMSLGNLIPRMPQGSLQWPKLTSDKQRKVSRYQGRIMMIFGILFLLLALLPASWIMSVFLALIFIFVILTISSTFFFTRN